VSGSVRIKICGLRDPDEARAAVDAGADLVGLNFVASSPRCIDIRTAEAICEALAADAVERVAVFANPAWEDVDRVLRRVDFERVQLHGEETEEEVEAVDLPVIKAVRGADLETASSYPGALLLLDHPSEAAGSGMAWDWADASELIESGLDVILAGGLNPENVATALEGVGDLPPWGVDVASGCEDGQHRKDAARMGAFVKAVRSAES